MRPIELNLLKRLTKFLDGFASAFVRGGQSGDALRYLQGLLGDAKRKNMEGMLQRLCDPGQYQTLQHFITHSTWDARAIWQQLRDRAPDRRGLLLRRRTRAVVASELERRARLHDAAREVEVPILVGVEQHHPGRGAEFDSGCPVMRPNRVYTP